MSKQSVVSEAAVIGPVNANPGCGRQIFLKWTSSGGISYGLNRQLTATLGIGGSAPTPIVAPKTQPVQSAYTDVVPDTQFYTYTVIVWDSPTHSVSRNSPSVHGNNSPCSVAPAGFLIQSTVDTFESRKGSFELLFPRGTSMDHYTHKKGSIQAGRWKHVNTLYAPEGGAIPDNAVSLLQSASGNFEAVAVVTPQDQGPNYLASYEFDPETGWQEPVILTADGQSITGATGSPALIQTQDGTFELFVPLGNSIGRYMHQQDSLQDGVWMPLAPFGTSDTLTYRAISLVLTVSGDLELVVRVTPTQVPQEGATDYLVSFVSSGHEPSTLIPAYVGPLTADGQSINGVTGSPTITQNKQGTFELVVPRGALMDQYIEETGTIGDNQWKHVSTLEPLKNAPGVQFTATSMIQSTSGKLELVARATPPQGEGEDYPVSYEFTGWKGPLPIVVDDTPTREARKSD